MRISGGLGNQMFQYALGRFLATKNNAELVLDLSGFMPKKNETFRQFSLDKFNTRYRTATEKDFKAPTWFMFRGLSHSLWAQSPGTITSINRIHRKLIRILESRRPITKRKFIMEPVFTFQKEILGITGNHYLSGVWQSEKYFKSNEDEIRRDFTLKNPLSPAAKNMEASIRSAEAVSVHIRRGDYVNDPHTLEKHGVCSVEYYEEAVNRMQSLHPSCRFFIFSDDRNWVEKNINMPKDSVYVSDGKAFSDYEELTLMSKCKHNITANSSFSWWGAWLNQNPDKTVIAPKKWFGEKNKSDTKDLIPESWIRM